MKPSAAKPSLPVFRARSFRGEHDHRVPYPGNNGILFEPIAPEQEHEDPEFHAYAVKLRNIHREIIISEKLSAEDKDLASGMVLAWASGKFARDWIRERKIDAAEAQRLKDAGVWPWVR